MRIAHNRFAIACAAILTVAATASADVLHVDDDAPLSGDGQSWSTAFRYLQDALQQAQAGDEIRIAGGSYKPDVDESGTVTPGDRFETFSLPADVQVLGAYAGLADLGSPDVRDTDTYETTLTGDLNGNDGPNFIGYNENSYQVVTAPPGITGTVLDGVTISGGSANGAEVEEQRGGALEIHVGSPITVRNCILEDSRASQYGGGAWCAADARFEDCRIQDNRMLDAGSAAGIYFVDCAPTMIGCEVRRNRGTTGGVVCQTSDGTLIDCSFSANTGLAGPGALALGRGDHVVLNCSFRFNETNNNAGGIFMYHIGSRALLANCLFQGNRTGGTGGGLRLFTANPTFPCEATVVNCTFGFNEADYGGAVYAVEACHVSLTNCILWDDDADVGGPEIAIDDPAGSATVSYSIVQGGPAAVYLASGATLNWGAGNLTSDPQYDGSYLHVLPTSPAIDAGDSTALPADTYDLDNDLNTTEPLPLDLDGLARQIDTSLPDTGIPGAPPTVAVVDIGAYEFQGDCNDNQIDDTIDLADCDGSPWCDDCNNNGVLDVCDIDSGTWADDDQDGIPDVCQREIPTLSQAALLVLAITLIAAAHVVLRRRTA